MHSEGIDRRREKRERMVDSSAPCILPYMHYCYQRNSVIVSEGPHIIVYLRPETASQKWKIRYVHNFLANLRIGKVISETDATLASAEMLCLRASNAVRR